MFVSPLPQSGLQPHDGGHPARSVSFPIQWVVRFSVLPLFRATKLEVIAIQD
jgi:hypothetical protein